MRNPIRDWLDRRRQKRRDLRARYRLEVEGAVSAKDPVEMLRRFEEIDRKWHGVKLPHAD